MDRQGRSKNLSRWIVGTAAIVLVAIGIAVLSARPSLTREEAVVTLERLLTRVYGSFDLTDEKATYRRLAECVTADRINQIYVDHRKSMESKERGGARAHVEDVAVIEVRSLRSSEAGSVLIDATWTVSGAVDHFGHAHQRRNRYDAVVRLVPADESWKIGGIEIDDQQREQ